MIRQNMDRAEIDHRFIQKNILRKSTCKLIADSIIRLTVISDSRFAECTFSAWNICTDCHTVSLLKSCHILSGFHYHSGYLMSQYLRRFYTTVPMMENPNVRSTDRTGFYFHQYTVIVHFWFRDLSDFNFIFLKIYCCFHPFHLFLCFVLCTFIRISY